MQSFRRLRAAIVLLALCGPAAILDADEPATPPSAQQIYDHAQAAFDNADWPAAITGLAAIANPVREGRLSHSQGIIHSRLAQAYAHLGKIEDAERSADTALKGLAADDHLERALLWRAIGEAQRFDLDIPRATASYERALEAAQQTNRSELATGIQLGLAQSYMTVDPQRAKSLMDAVLALPEVPSDPKMLRAQLYDLRGRASLNLGEPAEAMTFLTKAITLSGGVSGTRVNLVQVAIRGDAALGALLTKHPDDAREFLTSSGAGHLPSEEWTRGIGDPPICNEDAGIRADDMAVVEFSIATDGHVIGAAPIYVSRPGTLGIAFAQAVREWHWNPEHIDALPAFWRNMVRVEMRCITRPNPQRLTDPFRRQTLAWLSASSLSPEALAPLTRGFVARDDSRLDQEDLGAIPALMARLPIETERKRVQSISQHLLAALEKAGAPAAARALALHLKPDDPGVSSWSAERVRRSASQLATLAQSSPPSAASAWLTLEYAIALESNGRFKEAQPILHQVLAYPLDILDERDPVREVATLHLSALERRAGDTASADMKVRAAGLTRAQCLLFDVRPVPTDTSVSNSDYPAEAFRWGFDGYMREAFDIDATGHVENVRTIIAYPPFVFRSDAEHSVARFRYLAPVVDGGAAGCDGHAIVLSYRSAR